MGSDIPNGDSDPAAEGERQIRLPRVFSVWNTTAYIICVIIGSGIFVSPKGVLQLTVSPGMALVMWLVTGLVNALMALCYAELALTFPRAGSDFVYLREGWGALPAFLYIWVEIIFVEGCGKAIAALTFSTYFCQMFYPQCSPPDNLKKIVAGLTFSGLTAMHCYSSKFAVKTSDISTVAKLVGILIIIATGVVHVASGHTENLSNMFTNSSPEAGSYALAFYVANWAFGGVQSSLNIVEEIRPPVKRNLILSILASEAVIIAMYCLANVAYVAVLTPAEILSSDAVAMTLGEKVFGRVLFWVMPFFVSCSTFGNMNNSIMNSSRLTFAASRERHLPSPLSLLNAKYLTPIPIFVLSLAFTIALLCAGDIYSLIIYTSYMYGLSTFLSVAVLLKLRFAGTEADRPFRLPVLIPIAYLLVSLLLLALPVYQDPHSVGMCFAFIASGIPVYCFVRLEKKPKILLTVEHRALHLMQKLCYALPEDKVEREKLG